MRHLLTTTVLTFLAAAAASPSLVSGQASTAPSGPRKLAPLPPPLPRTNTPKPTKAPITPEDLKTRLYIFADDSMLGREAGTLGNVKGTDYIAAEAKRIGLQPAGDSGTYFQTIPLIGQTIKPATATFTVNGQSLDLWTDYSPIPGLSGPAPREIRDTALTVIYAGRAGESYQLSPSQTVGKIVVFLPPTDETIKSNPSALRTYPPRADNSAALAYVALDRFSPERREAVKTSRVVLDPQREIPKPFGKPTLYLSLAGLQKIFGKPADQLTPGDTVSAATLIYEFMTVPAPFPARNVVAVLPGSDPKLRNTYVAIGAHNDHEGVGSGSVDHDSLKAFNHLARIEGAEGRPRMLTADQTAELNATIAALRQQNPPRQDSIFNGADDDGSGTVTVLEIAEYLASLKGKEKPKRSILFVWHTAEEKGLWGSEWYTDNPTVPRDSIIAQLNIDMVGRGEASDNLDGNPDFLLLVGSRRLSTELGDLIETVNTQGKHNFKFDYSLDANGHPKNIYCRSDHYSYARYGIPVTFFTTGLHPDYHQVTDEAQYIDYKHMSRVASLIGDVALNLANNAQRPVVDKPKPNPHGACRQ